MICMPLGGSGFWQTFINLVYGSEAAQVYTLLSYPFLLLGVMSNYCHYPDK